MSRAFVRDVTGHVQNPLWMRCSAARAGSLRPQQRSLANLRQWPDTREGIRDYVRNHERVLAEMWAGKGELPTLL